MTKIYIVHGKPCIAVSNGFKPIDDSLYYMMIERSEIENIEVINHD